jgi:hypothetical protein
MTNTENNNSSGGLLGEILESTKVESSSAYKVDLLSDTFIDEEISAISPSAPSVIQNAGVVSKKKPLNTGDFLRIV